MATKISQITPGLHRQHVSGWVQRVRSQKKFSFLEIYDGTGILQVVLSGTTTIPAQSFVRVSGLVSRVPDGLYAPGMIEISADDVEVFKSETDYHTRIPGEITPEIKLAERHLWLRDPEFRTVLRAHAKLLKAIRAYCDSTGLIEITPPSFVGVECEGGATLFELSHPGKKQDTPMKVYLTQSSQFYLEMACPALGHTYCIAPSFRAEHSHTRRHLTEFSHFETEWIDIRKFEDHLDHLTQMLHQIIQFFLEYAKDELQVLGKYERVQGLLDLEIIQMTHSEAIEKCRELEIYKDPETKEHFGPRDDIPEAQERQLIDATGKIVLLTKFPKEFKSFYMALDPDDPSRVFGCDVEVPGVGEIIGSGVRESDPVRLTQRLVESGLKPDDYSEYLDLRRYGAGQTSGMGLGIGRLLCWLLDIQSIRDATAFPRFPGYARP